MNNLKNKLKKHERIICPAIWIDDKKNHTQNKKLNIPKNTKTGYVIYGLHIVDIFFRMNKNKKISYFNFKNKNNPKITEFHEGYYTSNKRFLKSLIDY